MQYEEWKLIMTAAAAWNTETTEAELADETSAGVAET
jgi:hypothetical protein